MSPLRPASIVIVLLLLVPLSLLAQKLAFSRYPIGNSGFRVKLPAKPIIIDSTVSDDRTTYTVESLDSSTGTLYRFNAICVSLKTDIMPGKQEEMVLEYFNHLKKEFKFTSTSQLKKGIPLEPWRSEKPKTLSVEVEAKGVSDVWKSESGETLMVMGWATRQAIAILAITGPKEFPETYTVDDFHKGINFPKKKIRDTRSDFIEDVLAASRSQFVGYKKDKNNNDVDPKLLKRFEFNNGNVYVDPPQTSRNYGPEYIRSKVVMRTECYPMSNSADWLQKFRAYAQEQLGIHSNAYKNVLNNANISRLIHDKNPWSQNPFTYFIYPNDVNFDDDSNLLRDYDNVLEGVQHIIIGVEVKCNAGENAYYCYHFYVEVVSDTYKER